MSISQGETSNKSDELKSYENIDEANNTKRPTATNFLNRFFITSSCALCGRSHIVYNRLEEFERIFQKQTKFY